MHIDFLVLLKYLVTSSFICERIINILYQPGHQLGRGLLEMKIPLRFVQLYMLFTEDFIFLLCCYSYLSLSNVVSAL